jgi:iron complex transport system substrate-binding protein
MMTASATAPGDIDAAVRALSHTGESLYALDATTIAALAPDLVLTQALCDVCAVSETDVRAVAARLASNPVVVTLSGSTWQGVADDIRRVGDALDRQEVASEVIASLDARLLAIHETLRAARAPRPRVVVIEWTDPIFAAGHWVPELVHRAGGREMMASAGDHSTVRSAGDIRNAVPELLIFAPCGYDLESAATAARDLLAMEEWSWAREVPAWAVDANSLLSRPGPRLVEAAETLASIIHPHIFPPARESNALRVS